MKKGLKKFFAICGIVTAAGLLMSAAGYAAGGLPSMGRISERYSWIQVGSERDAYTYVEGNEAFDSIDIDGIMGVEIKKGDSSKTRICYGDGQREPRLYVEDGVLKAESPYKGGGVVIGLGAERKAPVLEVYCEEGRTMKTVSIDGEVQDITIGEISAERIEVSNEAGNITMDGTVFSTGEIRSDIGNIDLENITSGGLSVYSDTGSCSRSGDLRGENHLEADIGDITLRTLLGEEEYTVDASVDTGSLYINGEEFGSYESHYRNGTGAHTINVISDTGNVELCFAQGAQRGTGYHHGEGRHRGL